MPLLAQLGIAWMLGIALARWFNLPWPVFVMAAIPAAVVFFLYKDNRQAKIWAGIALALIAGALRFTLFQPVFTPNHIAFYNDTPDSVTITGLVVDEPDIRDNYINLRLEAESINLADIDHPVEGLVLVRAPRYPERFYGDRLTVSGELETPPVFEDFSYKDYLARFGIHSMVRRPYISLIESKQGYLFWTTLYSFKAAASQSINRILTEPYASLLNGILLGIETGIPRGLYEDFNLTGTSHIIVISGSNISLVAGLLLLAGGLVVGKRFAPPLALAGILLYTLLVGADAAVQRAAVMGSLWVIAIWSGRQGMAVNALIFSGLFLSLLNPLILWDVGFQLSFVATLGLIVLVPPLERGTFNFLKQRLNTQHVGLGMALLSELLIITLAAQIITGPLIVYHFGRLSIVSLISNMLILPAQPPIMIVGGLATLAGMIWLPLGQLLSWLVWLPLAWSVEVVEHTAQWPLASLNLGTFPFWLLILMYAAIAAGVWWANQPRPDDEEARPRFSMPQFGSLKTRVFVGGGVVVALLMWLAVSTLPDGRLHVDILDVGQGDAILVTFPDGRQMLVDGGPSSTELNWRLGQQMPFWDHSLDLVVNTHPDADHLAGLVSLLDRYEVAQTLVADVEGSSQLYREWAANLREAQLTPIVGQTDMALAVSPGVTLTIISPGPVTKGIDEPNNHSVVMHLQYGNISFLLTGDIEKKTEEKLVRAGLPLQATILKSPHHGSKTSSSEAFLETVNPQLVVIPVGLDNKFGHPSPEVLERYAAYGILVLRTDQRGTIELITDGQQVWVETAR